jgi:hypothetical protein
VGCPSLDELLEFARGRLALPGRDAVASHLAAGCRRCAENQSWLAEVARAAAEDRSFDFPAEVIARAVALMPPRPAATGPTLGERIARLVFDSLMPPQLADVRAESPTAGAAGRQMLYRVEGYDIDLRFEQTEDGEAEELIGQILPEDRPPAEMPAFTVRLRRDEVETGRAQTDARGIFKFARIPSGVYDLRIEAHGVEIHIPQTSSARAS